MKSVFLLALAAFLSFNCAAQLTVFGGAQRATSTYNIRGVEQSTESKTGFMAGVGLKTLIEGPVYFSPLLSFSQKGYSVQFTQRAAPPDSGAVNNDVTIRSLELSPLVQFNLSKKADYVFLRVGPSFEFNLSGTERFDSANGRSVNRAMPFAFDKYSYATISVNLHAGYQHRSGFSLFAFYHHGVGNLNNSDFGPSILLRTGGLAAAWKFGKKK